MKVITINTETKERIENEPVINIEDPDTPFGILIVAGQTVQIIDKDDNVIDERTCSEGDIWIHIKNWNFCDEYVLDWDKVETAEEFFQILKSKPFRWDLKINLLPDDWNDLPDDIKRYFDKN